MIFWLDLETTGLNPEKDAILEVALIVTEDNMIIRQTYEAVIQQSQSTMDKMNDWCQNQHTKSGLIASVWSDQSKPFGVVKSEINEIMDDYYSPNDRPLLAGSSIHFDRNFLRNNFHYFDSRLHYRMLDVSSLKEAFKRQLGIEYPKPNAEAAHRAMPDIKGSMEEYMFYMNHFKVKNERN